MLTLEELKEKIIEHYDADLLVEVLKIDTKEIVEFFEDKILDMADFFEEEFGLDEEE